jgi:hypothetical protein
MKSFIFCWLAFVPTFTFEQTLSIDLWHEGKVVLESGDTIQGLVKYDLKDLLQVRHANQLESFSAQKISRFEILDRSCQCKRQFMALPFAKVGQYKTPVLFELIAEGKITLLSRERIEARTISTGHINNAPRIRRSLKSDYFLLNDKGDIETFSGKNKKNWYDLMENKSDEVSTYVKDGNLDIYKKYDLQKIIDYYNSLFKK